MKFYQVTLFFMLLVLIVAIGCDEGLNMSGEVIGTEPAPPTEVAEVVDEAAEEGAGGTIEPVVAGEMKQPDPVTEAVEVPTETAEGAVPTEDPAVESVAVPQGPVEVIEISYYADPDLTHSLMDPPYFGTLLYGVGKEIYTKVVFSRAVSVVTGDPEVAQPKISYRFSGDESPANIHYGMRPSGFPTDQLRSGEAKPLEASSVVFIGKYVLPEMNPWTFGAPFFTYHDSRSEANTDDVVDVNRAGSALDITDPPLISSLLTGADATHPAPASNPGDFVGQVCLPVSVDGFGGSDELLPAPGVLVTIIAGPRSGEQVTSSPSGYYLFRDVEGDELHLRVEREHFETQEVIVHRSRPTAIRTPKNGVSTRITGWDKNGPWRQPGVILVGQYWPEEIRFIFEEMLLPDDLLLIVDDETFVPNMTFGAYIAGLVKLKGGQYYDSVIDHGTGTILHEIAHAHQEALAILEFGEDGHITDWERTAEGRAYAEAQAKDWREYGKTRIDQSFELQYPESAWLIENAAETAAWYWGVEYLGGISYLRTQAPNRLRWAQEWLNKRY